MCKDRRDAPKITGHRPKHVNARPYKKDKYKLKYEDYA